MFSSQTQFLDSANGEHKKYSAAESLLWRQQVLWVKGNPVRVVIENLYIPGGYIILSITALATDIYITWPASALCPHSSHRDTIAINGPHYNHCSSQL